MNDQAWVRNHDRTQSDVGLASPVSTIRATAPRTPGSHRRQRLSVFLSASLLERLRNAVYWTQHRPLAQIIADAIEDAVTEMEQSNGGVFPPRLAPLKAGRPKRVRAGTPATPLPNGQTRT